MRAPAQTGIEDEMVRFWTKIAKGERGQALVETALAVPLLLFIVLGMVDLGKAFNYANDLTHLANEAARYATVNYCVPDGSGGCTPLEIAVKNDAETNELKNGGGSIEGSGVTITFCKPDNQRITAKATATYRFIPGLPFHRGIHTSSTMYLEQPNPLPAHYTAPPC
jgi:hypothetical protein